MKNDRYVCDFRESKSHAVPRVMIAGTGSGTGKTTLVLALLKALKDKGYSVASAKCGPDYIDPMFHSRVIGKQGINLDPFFFKRNVLNRLLLNNAGNDITVIEGVMGYYDGYDTSSPAGSSFEVARLTDTPVILNIDTRGASHSVLAVIKGFAELYADSGIAGVILNRCSEGMYRSLAESINARFDGKIKTCGYLPYLPECSLKSRHLGLSIAGKNDGLDEKLSVLSETAQKTIEWEKIFETAKSAPEISEAANRKRNSYESVRIAVAKDEAFCFIYRDSLSVLEEMGAEIVFFSPLEDQGLPEGIHGLILPGGYPELYAERLSASSAMLSSVRTVLENGLPCIAECGGFMYLTERINGLPMVGYLAGNCENTGKLSRFGYVTLKSKKDCLLCNAGEQIRGHEFHYWDCTENGSDFTAEKISGKKWDCVFATDRLYAGFPHFHFEANPAFAERFYKACIGEKHRYD